MSGASPIRTPAAAGGGCVDVAANQVECPDNDENVDLRFATIQGGTATMAPADAQLDFNSEVVLRQGSDTLIAGDGADVVTSQGTPGAGTSDDLSMRGGGDTVETSASGDVIRGEGRHRHGELQRPAPCRSPRTSAAAPTTVLAFAPPTRAARATTSGQTSRTSPAARGIDMLTGDSDPNVLTAGGSDDTLAAAPGTGPGRRRQARRRHRTSATRSTYSPAGGTARTARDHCRHGRCRRRRGRGRERRDRGRRRT